ATVVLKRFMTPEELVLALADSGCTGFAGVPNTYELLLGRSTFAERSWPALRYVTVAGGKLRAEATLALSRALPKTSVFVRYGATETTAMSSYLPPELLAEKLGSVGKGLPGAPLAVLRPDGSPVSPGEVGELVVRGPHVTKGYFGAADETPPRFR